MPRSLVILLAFVAGWVDASSFVGLDHVMAAHITGNLVVLASDVAQGFTGKDSLKVVILPVFFLGVMLVTLVHDRFIARIAGSVRQLARLLECEAGLIALSGLLGIWVSLTGIEQDFWIALLVVTPVTFGMAVQNAAHRLYPAIGPATTVMTGNITQFFIDKARALGGRTSVSKIDDMPRNENILPLLILAFGTGCVTGALATAAVGNGAFLLAAAVVVANAATLRQHGVPDRKEPTP
ncbi:MAG: YoaK family protein [Proteobacteria bacterium]|nr:YoaK family protein [Pseudomonadota bacterium]MDA0953003.1 YoaK family protein [Pseudomonadota bacterium]MDA1071610.1 YoaK family protein [Pseudomonadota bacterium]